MKIFIEKEYFYASSNGADPTDYFRKQHQQRYRNWDQVLNQLIVLYGERLTEYL